MGYIDDTVVTILLLTAKFAPAQSVKDHEAREAAKATEDLAARMRALDELRVTDFYEVVIDKETERMLTRLLDAVQTKKASQQETEKIMGWMTQATNLITSHLDPDPLADRLGSKTLTKEQKRMSAIVGAGVFVCYLIFLLYSFLSFVAQSCLYCVLSTLCSAVFCFVVCIPLHFPLNDFEILVFTHLIFEL